MDHLHGHLRRVHATEAGIATETEPATSAEDLVALAASADEVLAKREELIARLKQALGDRPLPEALRPLAREAHAKGSHWEAGLNQAKNLVATRLQGLGRLRNTKRGAYGAHEASLHAHKTQVL